MLGIPKPIGTIPKLLYNSNGVNLPTSPSLIPLIIKKYKH